MSPFKLIRITKKEPSGRTKTKFIEKCQENHQIEIQSILIVKISVDRIK